MTYSSIKQYVKKLDFLRYGIAPGMRRLQLSWNKFRADRSVFSHITDLKSVSSTRGWVYRMASPGVIQHVAPSKTIPEAALELVHQAGQWVDQIVTDNA